MAWAYRSFQQNEYLSTAYTEGDDCCLDGSSGCSCDPCVAYEQDELNCGQYFLKTRQFQAVQPAHAHACTPLSTHASTRGAARGLVRAWSRTRVRLRALPLERVRVSRPAPGQSHACTDAHTPRSTRAHTRHHRAHTRRHRARNARCELAC
eukprot:6199859-Pleurochrysis_carterae.AAC.1